MDKDEGMKIIIVLLIIIIALLAVICATMPHGNDKQDTKLIFKNNETIDEGDSLKIKLTDDNGTGIVNQTVNITITNENNLNSYYSVVTDEDGDGKLELIEGAGKYNVTISYGGNDNYTGCSATKKIIIAEKDVKSTVSESSNSDSSSQNLQREEYQITPDGWNPREHEVSRISIGNGNERVSYDDGYFVVVDHDGHIITHGWQ